MVVLPAPVGPTRATRCPGSTEKDDGDTDGQDYDLSHLENTHGCKATYPLDVARGSGHQFAGARVVVKLERKALDVIVELVA